ncbi:MAG: PrgI family protein [Christensenellales bacterium]
MEVRINKEVRDYTESIFFGLNLRQFAFSLLAVFIAVGLYFTLGSVAGTEEIGWICILGAAPFAACGFFKYNGMPAERFVIAWLRSEFLYPRQLVYKAENTYAVLLAHSSIKEELRHD